MKRKPKWWNIDWVELGCRGWDIEIDGASLGPQRENPWEWDYADLDRTTLHIVLSGRPAFVARVVSDLVAAGVFRIIEESNTCNMTMDVGGFGTNYPTTGNTTAASGYSIKLVA